MTKCRSCGALIVWLKTSSGKLMPVDAASVKPGEQMFSTEAGHVSHFATCPNADKHRKDKDKLDDRLAETVRALGLRLLELERRVSAIEHPAATAGLAPWEDAE